MALVFAQHYRTPYSTRAAILRIDIRYGTAQKPSHGKVVGSYEILLFPAYRPFRFAASSQNYIYYSALHIAP
uniref:Uncharacterized protein n=1 Tax=Candidatus Kentrum sp. DK TaxID=2126562 RepID=A0A450ST29_9GAMM|nr:MAG: hypothetical protein BECKDK2373C_GA0170839_105817 [Candidatus Kentron sp. DK]